MVVFQTHASLAQSAPAPLMALSHAANVHWDTVVMASHVRTLTNAKKSQMLAILITVSIVVRTLNQVTTVSHALVVSPVLNHLEEELNRQLLRNRFVNYYL